MAQPLAQGELLYVTDDQRLYIGNGSTLGGVQITGYNDENAQDAAASIFTNGIHTGINFVYSDLSNRIDASVDLSNYTGVIRADAFKGSVFADDGSTIGGTLLVDAVAGSINLNGTVKGNIIPDTNIAYDLGSSSRRFRDLYLSGSSIKLGDATITATGSAVNLPAGSTINGVPLAIPGETSLTVDIIGSVFGDDSSVIVDSIDKTITANRINSNLINGGSNPVEINANSSLYISQNYGLTTGTTGPRIAIRATRGADVTTPTTTQAGDYLGQFLIEGYAGGIYKDAAAIYGIWDPTANLNDFNPRSGLVLIVGTGTGQAYAGFNYKGSFTAPIIQPSAYATESARNSAITSPDAGMMTYITDICKFQGYVLDTGLAGGGASNTTPGWVNLN
jgi:hypothetical protein